MRRWREAGEDAGAAQLLEEGEGGFQLVLSSLSLLNKLLSFSTIFVFSSIAFSQLVLSSSTSSLLYGSLCVCLRGLITSFYSNVCVYVPFMHGSLSFAPSTVALVIWICFRLLFIFWVSN